MRGLLKTHLLIVLLLLCVVTGKAQTKHVGNIDFALRTIEGTEIAPADLGRGKLMLFVFLGEGCPASQKYALQLKKLYQEYKRVATFYAVFLPDLNGETGARDYLDQYGFPGEVLLDQHLQLTEALGATITPEVFLLSKERELIYAGAIDNWYYALGKYRRVVTEHYLSDAIAAHLKGQQPPIPRTQAIGCFINRKPRTYD